MVWAVVYTSTQNKEKTEKLNLLTKLNAETFINKKKEYNVSESNMTLSYKRGYAKIEYGLKYVWKDDENNLCFFPAIALDNKIKYILYKIPLVDIEYFYTRGETFSETKISGGGGQIGGSSLTGAIVGGVIAGGVGAIIGSRKKGTIEPIKSEIVTHDQREVYINYFVDSTRHSMFFNFKDYDVLQILIPEKEYNFSNKSQINANTYSTSDITKQIKELAELKDNGILTENEFNEKKKILLNKIQ